MKKLLLIGLIFILSGCGVVSDLFDSKDDILTAIASGDISFLKSNINDFLDQSEGTAIDCADHIQDIGINVYQATSDGEMYLRSDSSIVDVKSSTTEACTYSYEVGNLNSGLTTVESIMKKEGKEKKIVQRVSDSLEQNKTNLIKTMTPETSEICDRVIPIILEKYSDEIEKSKLAKLGETEFSIYIDIIVDTVKETIESLKEVKGFEEYNVTALKPMADEFLDVNTNRITAARYKNVINDYSKIKNACDIDNAGQNYIDKIELEYNMKHNHHDETVAKDIIVEVFGEEMVESAPAAIELMANAYAEDKKVTLEKVSKAILAAMDFQSALDENKLDPIIENVPTSYTDILNFIKTEITNEEGLINNVFDDYDNDTESYRNKYKVKNYKTAQNKEAMMTTKGVRAVFHEDHKWKNKTNVENSETVNILELWTVLMMQIDAGRLHEDYLDLSKFFYELDIIDMSKPFVVDVYIEKDDSKSLNVIIVDTTNIISKIKTSITLENPNNIEQSKSIELSNVETYGFDKNFSYELSGAEINSYKLKSGEITLQLLNQSGTVVVEHKQKIFDFNDIFQEATGYDDYYAGFEHSDDNYDYIYNEYQTIDKDYINGIIKEEISAHTKNVITNKTIKDKGITEIDDDLIFQEGQTSTLDFDKNKIMVSLDNNYISDFNIIYQYKILEVIIPISGNTITELYEISSYYNPNEIKYWEHFEYEDNNFTKAHSIVAEGEISLLNADIELELPQLEPNEYNLEKNYYTHYKACIRHIVEDASTGYEIHHSNFKCIPYFIEQVTYE